VEKAGAEVAPGHFGVVTVRNMEKEVVKNVKKSWVSAGLLVTMGNNVTGMVPRLFLSDVQLSYPEKNYLPGDKLAVKVLRFNHANRQLHQLKAFSGQGGV
jgi:ribosomal protein S1